MHKKCPMKFVFCPEGGLFLKKLLSFLLIFGLMAGFLFWENLSICAKEEMIALPALPKSFDSLRLVQISDLHGRSFGEDNARLIDAVEKADPDLICITGDLFDEKSDLSFLTPLLTALTALAPTYYVTGNHEWQVASLRDILSMMQALGVNVLQNTYHVLHHGGEKLVLAGVDDPCGPLERIMPDELVRQIRSNEGENVPILMLSHRNDELPMWSELNVMLVLSGHCHGGVVRLPLVGGVFGTHRELFPEYDAGIYRKNGTALYVSRGLGFSSVRFRLLNRPQLSVLCLKNPNS